jgi:hypothetical protein
VEKEQSYGQPNFEQALGEVGSTVEATEGEAIGKN